jgi:hypothetical protein
VARGRNRGADRWTPPKFKIRNLRQFLQVIRFLPNAIFHISKKLEKKYLVTGFNVRNNLAYLNFVPNSMSFEIMIPSQI